jgi:hypothetical protein
MTSESNLNFLEGGGKGPDAAWGLSCVKFQLRQ